MDNGVLKGKKKRGRLSLRTAVQLGFAAATNGYLPGFLQGKIFTGKTKQLCVPGLNCYSCPGALGSCPIGSLQAVLCSRDFSVSWYVTGFLILIGAIFGRFVCGWLCPFGFVQELLHKLPIPKKLRIKVLPGEKWLTKIKYGILLIFVILLPSLIRDIVGQGQPWFCKWICPSGTLLAGFPMMLADERLRDAAGGLFAWKVVVLVILLLASLVIYRPFCRYLCPLGAVYGVFNPISFYRIRLDETRCTTCGTCQKICEFNIPVYQKPNSPECIRCGDCVKSCPHAALHKGYRNNHEQHEK